ncbi:ParM/StbA family protein [Clostridium perfringens]|uniref:ParM/StbA family protein n=1 Tax=Clostridium perfringens TaxID=1502 RepID=UPI0018E47FDC|nr:ParM/StbA family protein [Clostridium perfringens]MBI6054515.1 ParM/StbA family protein [Clostridium perfringens]
MILGLDIGNITSICIGEDTEFMVESRIKDYEELNSFSTTDIVEIEGRKMLFNEGYFENNIIKHEKENFLNLVYYTIAKTLEGTNESAVKIVIGIPAGQYNSEKDNLKKLINQNCCKTININGEYKTVTIEDVFIAPEGYGVKIEALKNLDNKAKTLIVDIGGGTTDVAEFDENGRFIGGKSIKTGLLDLYKEVQEVLDIKYKLNVSLEDAKKYFDGELDVRNDNFEVETEYKKEILLKLIKYLVNELRGYYPNLKQYNLVLSGGAAKRVHPAFKKLYPQTQAVTDIKANAKGFRKVGLAKWQKK